MGVFQLKTFYPTNKKSIFQISYNKNKFSYYIKTNLDELDENIFKFSLNLKGEIKNFEKINMEICFDSIEFWMEYNYYIENSLEDFKNLELGCFYKYEKGWRYFPTFQYS